MMTVKYAANQGSTFHQFAGAVYLDSDLFDFAFEQVIFGKTLIECGQRNINIVI